LVVGVSEVSDGVGTAFDALDKHIVVLGKLQILGAEDRLFLLLEDMLDEVGEGSGVCSGAEAEDFLGGPGGADI